MTTLVSVGSDGVEGNRFSWGYDFSHDGRLVAFASAADNLIPGGDVNGFSMDVFVHDRLTNTTRLVSVRSNGTQGKDWSDHCSLSGNAMFVVFSSAATNLVGNDNNGSPDCFRHNLVNGKTRRMTIDDSGVEGDQGGIKPDVSDDGTQISFQSSSTNFDPRATGGAHPQVYVRDHPQSKVVLLTVGFDGNSANDWCTGATMSGDGRHVYFRSAATNLVAGDTNNTVDSFVADRDADGNGVFDEGDALIRMISVAPDGTPGNGTTDTGGISHDGRHIGFTSAASNLVPNDTNGTCDVFVRDRDPDENGIFDEGNEVTVRVSVASDGTEGNGTSQTSNSTVVSNTGLVVFDSVATNLVASDTNGQSDCFLHDLETGVTSRFNLRPSGDEALQWSGFPIITPDGRNMALVSNADLVSGVMKNIGHAFVRGPELSLVADAVTLTTGDTLTLSAWDGLVSTPAMLFLVGVDGAPLFLRLETGVFDAAQAYSYSAVIPAGVAPANLTLRTYAIGWFTGQVVRSNDVDVSIQ